MGNQQSIKIFLALMLSTAYIFSFSHFGALAYNTLFKNTDAFAAGTAIGHLDISEKTAAEAERLLEEEVEKWKAKTKITFSYKEKKAEADTALYEFYIEETLRTLKQGQKNLAAVDVDQEVLEEMIYRTSISLGTVEIDTKKLAADLLIGATMLDESGYTFHLENYIPEAVRKSETISKATVNAEGSLNEIKALLKKMGTVEIPAKAQFSFLRLVEEKDIQMHHSSALSIMGTAIYQAILPTNFSIIERYISNALPSYAKLGYEAKVDEKKQMDLVFSNLNDSAYSLQLSLKGNKLEAILKGQPFLNKYSIVKKDEQSFTPKTVKQYNARLESGETQVIESGKTGLLVKMVRKIFGESGELMKTEIISEDFYAPVHKVVVHSPVEPVQVTEQAETGAEEGEEEEQETPDSTTDENVPMPVPGAHSESEDGTEVDEEDNEGDEKGTEPQTSDNTGQGTDMPAGEEK
ncbi:VanW family protein [Peribacillus glennii]|uniref:G5 domain-containing protein n=1 Tax=Peribacillus glennii TaxID=2303991 RepID=A0A372LIS7_9BACI|nr:VanW family protein [Peribacillus glennii]RFU65884.1 hypothetical protein D0466_08460 [Peribacillus glennii]